MDLIKAVDVFTANAPDDSPKPQLKANAAWGVIKSHLETDEIFELISVLSAAIVRGASRERFDEVMAAVKTRLSKPVVKAEPVPEPKHKRKKTTKRKKASKK